MSSRRTHPDVISKRAFLADLRAGFPPFFEVVAADARKAAVYRGDPPPAGRKATAVLALRLIWETDAFFALVAYRARCSLQRRGVPVLPRLLHRWSMASAQLCIGDPVHVDPGVYIPHGQVVVDGITRVGSGVVLSPWVTIGLRAGDFGGPTLEPGVQIGTGAKVIGPVTVGRDVKVGANAVVIHDVDPGTTVVGQPARPVKAASGATQIG